MQKNITYLLSLNILFFLTACSKNSEIPSTSQCSLATISDDKAKVMEKFTYDTNGRLITDASDSLTFTFSYNSQNLVDKIGISGLSTSGSFSYSIANTYNTSGQLQKAVLSVSSGVYQTNVFTYTGSQITSVTSTDYQANVLVSRFVYTGENISQVYQKFASDPEYKYYEILKFDTNKSPYPDAYRSLALGLVGLVDDFTYLNKNNAITEKYYDTTDTLSNTYANTYTYNATFQPTRVSTLFTKYDGSNSSYAITYQYTCK